MHLSTSSSEDRLPALPAGRAWLAALALIVLVLGGWEILWRTRGFIPELIDSPRLWGMVRSRVTADPRQIVFIGDSRTQLDIDPRAFARAFPGSRPLMLAIDGTDPFPVILHFADDQSFRGILISSPSQIIYAQRKDVPIAWKLPESYVHLYRTRSPADALEVWVMVGVQKLFVFPSIDILQVAAEWRAGKWPQPRYASMALDRVILADYSRSDLEKVRKVRVDYARTMWDELSPAAERDRNLARMEDAVRRITDRGGRVIFVNFPTTGETRNDIDRRFPRDRFWDPWSRSTAAITIDSADYPELSRFDVPDYSHLDQKDAPAYSEALARVIAEKLKAAPKKL